MSTKSRKKRIAVLGATGSIGTQALEVIAAHRDHFEAPLLMANENIAPLRRSAMRCGAEALLVAHPQARAKLQAEAGHTLHILSPDALEEALCRLEIDLVLVALVGFAGLRPTLQAISAKKDIALANKETLVVAGHLVMKEAKRQGVKILPVDSEHSALFQCLLGESEHSIDKVILTASGGPFWQKKEVNFAEITPQQALTHPNWTMGAKISVDSATMLNKGFEVIEAHWLFSLPASRIEVLVHKESIVHALIKFVDGSYKAHLGAPDMRVPIQLAFSYPKRLPLDVPALSIRQLQALSFEAPDDQRFPALPLAYEVLRKGGNTACILNAANECAVQAFLAGHISFSNIIPLSKTCLQEIPYLAHPSYDELLETDTKTRQFIQKHIQP